MRGHETVGLPSWWGSYPAHPTGIGGEGGEVQVSAGIVANRPMQSRLRPPSRTASCSPLFLIELLDARGEQPAEIPVWNCAISSELLGRIHACVGHA